MHQRRNIVILLSILIFSLSLQAQQNDLDSLLKVLKTTGEDTVRVNLLIEIASSYKDTDPLKALQYAHKSLKLSGELNFRKGIAESKEMAGVIYENKGDFIKAMDYFKESLKIYKAIRNKKQLSGCQKNIGRIYEKQGDYNNAIRWYLTSLKIMEETGDKQGIASNTNNIGLIYYHQYNYDKAMEYFERALELAKELQNKNAIAITLNNIGNIYDQKKQYDKAIEFYINSLKIKQELGNKMSIAKSLNNIANMYCMQRNYKNALTYYKESLRIKEELGDKSGIISTYLGLGVLYQEQHQLTKSLEYIDKALAISREIGYKEGIKNSYLTQSELFAAIKDFQKAYETHKQYSHYNDTMFNERNQEVIAELQEKYEADKREKEIALKNAELQVKNIELDKKNAIIYAIIGGLFLAVTLIFFVLRSYFQKRKANKLLAQQNEQIMRQKSVIEAKNRDIMDSIRYAKRIQEAILPPAKLVKESFQNSFILYRPKDIVSGDFFWMDAKDNKVFFSAVDCTGHGVPGAFMSIVGHNGLNQAINENNLFHPGEILDQLNQRVKATLHQTDKMEVKDGMDMALCTIDFDRNKVEFAGANNPVYIVREKNIELIVNGKKLDPSEETDKNSLFEIKGNKQPIGASEITRNFTNHEFDFRTGDSIYVFSDGYADQFGGPENKKFKYRALKILLLNIQDKPLSEQKNILEETFEKWRGTLEQVDDICVIGVKI